MKKMSKLFALIASFAIITGGMFISCSSGGGGGGEEPEPEPIDTGKPTYEAVNITVEELSQMNPVPVAGSEPTKLAAGTYLIWGGKGAVVTQEEKMSIQINTGKETPVAIVSATNMTGMNAVAVPVVDANLKSIMPDADSNGAAITGDQKPVNYVVVEVPEAGKNLIKLNFSTGASTKDLPDGLSYWILATDEDGKILAVKDIGDIKSKTYTKSEIELGTAVLGQKVCLGFARGAGSGSIKIHSITLTKTAKSAAESKPTATNFVAAACTSGDQNDGKITISNEDASKLEFKLGDGEWADVKSLSLENLTPGTYSFRYKETDEFLASEAIIVEVEKWVDESKVFEGLNFESFAVGKYKVEANTEKKELAKQADADGLWEFAGTSSASAEIKEVAADYFADATNKNYVAGDKTYTKRLSLGNKENQAYVKVKVGAGKETMLRIDACANSKLTESKLKVEGASEEVLSFYWVGSRYVKVTGDSDGYVKFTIKGSNAVSILGIYVVSEGVAKTDVTLPEGTSPVYTAPVIALSPASVKNEDNTSVTVTVTDATVTAYKVYSDGSADVDKKTYTSEVALTGADGATLPVLSDDKKTITVSAATTVGDYKVKVTATLEGQEPKTAEATLKVTDKDATDDNDGSVYTLTPAVIGENYTALAENNWSTSAYSNIFYLGGKVSCDGSAIKTNGKLQYKSGGIKFTTTAAATVVVNFKTGSNNNERHVAYAPIEDSKLGNIVVGINGSASNSLEVTETFNISEAGTYVIGSNPSDSSAGSITITSIEVKF